jgi:hypothetical protein
MGCKGQAEFANKRLAPGRRGNNESKTATEGTATRKKRMRFAFVTIDNMPVRGTGQWFTLDLLRVLICGKHFGPAEKPSFFGHANSVRLEGLAAPYTVKRCTNVTCKFTESILASSFWGSQE